MCSTLFSSPLFCGVQHGPQTCDFPTFLLRLHPRDYAPLVMQLASAKDVATFVGSTRDKQVALLHDALRQAIDAPLVVPIPHTSVPVTALSPLILTTASQSGALDEDEVLALCNVAHIPVPQDTDFVFKHDCMDDVSCEWVLLLVPRLVAPAPRTWRSWVTDHTSPLDTHFGMNASVATLLGQHLDYILRCTYEEEEDPQSAVRMFLHRTHFATHFAYAYIPNMVLSSWLAETSQCKMLPYVRAALMSRTLFSWDWPQQESTLPDFKPQKYILVSGIRE